MKTINVAKDYTKTPGARYVADGPFSGEEFRNKFLEPHFAVLTSTEPLEIILDGTEGFATSFLEEAFGGLARKFGSERCLKLLKLVSKEDDLLLVEITDYIKDADAGKPH